MPDSKANVEPAPAPKRWSRWLMTAAVGLVLLVVGALAGDYFWYRARVPLSFYDANWAGHWKTDFVGLIRGRILVKLPDPLPENEPFQAKALVYYPIYSVYRTGQFVPMDFAAEYSPDSASSGGAAERLLGPSGGKLKFKGAVGRQVVEYVALFSPGGHRIIGSYESHGPYDYGHFLLEKQ